MSYTSGVSARFFNEGNLISFKAGMKVRIIDSCGKEENEQRKE